MKYWKVSKIPRPVGTSSDVPPGWGKFGVDSPGEGWTWECGFVCDDGFNERPTLYWCEAGFSAAGYPKNVVLNHYEWHKQQEDI